jgi:hypothetical protein
MSAVESTTEGSNPNREKFAVASPEPHSASFSARPLVSAEFDDLAQMN